MKIRTGGRAVDKSIFTIHMFWTEGFVNVLKFSRHCKKPIDLFQDYMILIPQAYYEATILQNTVYRPCLTPDDKGPYVIS